MKIENGKIVFENKECYSCNGHGHPLASKTCPDCLGSGNGKRGKRGGCRSCFGRKTVTDFSRRDTSQVCEICKGSKVVMEDRHDWCTTEIWQSLNFKVNRDPTGRFGFNESYLGLGYVSCITDYGTAFKANDDAALIESVRKEKQSSQVCNFTEEDGTLCDYILIIVTRSGYKLKAVYADGTALKDPTPLEVAVLFNPLNPEKAVRQMGQAMRAME
jgi:hypothetical protein